MPRKPPESCPDGFAKSTTKCIACNPLTHFYHQETKRCRKNGYIVPPKPRKSRSKHGREYKPLIKNKNPPYVPQKAPRALNNPREEDLQDRNIAPVKNPKTLYDLAIKHYRQILKDCQQICFQEYLQKVRELNKEYTRRKIKIPKVNK